MNIMLDQSYSVFLPLKIFPIITAPFASQLNVLYIFLVLKQQFISNMNNTELLVLAEVLHYTRYWVTLDNVVAMDFRKLIQKSELFHIIR